MCEVVLGIIVTHTDLITHGNPLMIGEISMINRPFRDGKAEGPYSIPVYPLNSEI